VQDGHKVDNRIVPMHKGRKLRGGVYIGLNYFHAWKHLNATRWQASCWHRDAVAMPAQRFANMATNKTASAQH
jgi:hypothetical protein